MTIRVIRVTDINWIAHMTQGSHLKRFGSPSRNKHDSFDFAIPPFPLQWTVKPTEGNTTCPWQQLTGMAILSFPSTNVSLPDNAWESFPTLLVPGGWWTPLCQLRSRQSPKNRGLNTMVAMVCLCSISTRTVSTSPWTLGSRGIHSLLWWATELRRIRWSFPTM